MNALASFTRSVVPCLIVIEFLLISTSKNDLSELLCLLTDWVKKLGEERNKLDESWNFRTQAQTPWRHSPSDWNEERRRRKPAWLMDLSILSDFFLRLTVSRFFLLYSILLCVFFFVFVKEIPIACNLSSMNSFSFLFFVLFEWSNGIRLCNFQMWVSNWNDLTTYQHDSWVLLCSTLLHVRSPDNETFFTCLVIETERNKKCIM